MPAARIICPGCKTIITSAQAFEPGKIVDCPSCQLLFVPTSADLAVTAPSPSPFPPRRRRFKKRTELRPVVLIGLALVILSIFVGAAYFLGRSSNRSTSPPIPAPASARIAEPDQSASGVPEVEDDRPPPRRPVPSLDDDAPGKPPPP